MAISFGGLNSGLPPNIVEQLVEAEKIPIKMEEAKIQKDEAKLELVADLEGKLTKIRSGINDLANIRGFSDLKLESSDANILNGVVDPKSARPGNWSLEVTKLAKKASAVTNGFPDKDKTQVGVGYLRFKTKDGNKDVYISKANSTLSGVAQAINNSNAGMRATVIDDRTDTENPFRLVIARDEFGKENNVEYPTIYLLDGDTDLFFKEERPAENAIIKVDGFEMQLAENKLEGMIPGVVLDLKGTAPGKEINITVKEDIEKIGGKMKEFVDSINAVLGFIQKQNKMDGKTDNSKTLGGDSMLRSIEFRLRGLLQGQFRGLGNIDRLSQLGIVFNRNGTLDFDQKKMDSLLATTPEQVQVFLAGDGVTAGFASRIKGSIDNLLNSSFGPVSNKRTSLQGRIDQSNRRIENKERQLVRREEQLRRQFSKLEETMSKLKSQGQAVSAMGGGIGG